MMTLRHLTTVGLCILYSAAVTVAWPGPKRTGLDDALAFADLPYFSAGTLTWQTSSNDPTGDNGDGLGCNHWIYHDGEYIVMDAPGPGCIQEIWMTALPPGNIRIYFDHETTPRVNLGVAQFFSGNVSPFRYPLAASDDRSSGGFYCKVPMTFAQRARIAFTDPPCYWHVVYQTYPPLTPVVPFTMSLDTTPLVNQWSATGTDPKSTAGNVTVTGNVTVPTGQGRTAWSFNGAGSVAALKIDPSPASDAVLQNVWLSIFCDGAASPQVQAPLGLFFGCGEGEENVRGLPIGMSKTGYYYCYYPMPFWQSIRVDFYNGQQGDVSIPFEVQYKTVPYGEDAGYFCARYKREHTTAPGMDYLILETSGTGHYMGCSLLFTADGPGYGYLEGDERIYIDGSRTPQWYGTGTEDYLLGGWYFKNGAFSLPTHGLSRVSYTGYVTRTSMYRFHIGDRIPFTRHIVVGMEHGGHNEAAANYSSVAYYYWKPAPSSVTTAQLNIGDAQSEALHDYSNTGQIWSGSLNTLYEGDWDEVYVPDTGRAVDVESRFSLPLAQQNYGMFLRRRMDQAGTRQRGELWVEGRAVTAWESLRYNPIKRWNDAWVYVPPEWTQGKSRVNVKIQSANWNEYRYWADSLVRVTGLTTVEAEGRTPSGSSGRPYVTLDKSADINWAWSGRAAAEYQAQGNGDWVALRMPVPQAGWYLAYAVLGRENPYGIVRVSVQGTPAADTIDLYTEGYRKGPLASPGVILQLTGADCEFRFDVVGKNSASGGYRLAIDTLCLARIDAGPPATYTPPVPTVTPTRTPLPTSHGVVRNGDFEQGFQGTGVANHWVAYQPTGHGSVYQDRTDNPRGGLHSQGWSMPPSDYNNRHAGIYQRIPAYAGRQYRITAYAKTIYTGPENNSWDNVMALLVVDPLGDAGPRSYWNQIAEFHSDHNVWHRASLIVTAGGNGYINVMLDGWRKQTDAWRVTGYIYFDDVTVEDLMPWTPTPSPIPTATPTPTRVGAPPVLMLR